MRLHRFLASGESSEKHETLYAKQKLLNSTLMNSDYFVTGPSLLLLPNKCLSLCYVVFTFLSPLLSLFSTC